MIYNAYGVDLRERVLSFIDSGNSKYEAERVFKVSRKTIYNWINLKSKSGNISIKPVRNIGGYKLDHSDIEEYINSNNDKTLKEIAYKFSTCQSAIFNICCKLNITRKKNRVISGKG